MSIKVIEFDKPKRVLAFVATCIEATARTLNTSYKEVFSRMMSLGLIDNYIYQNYEVLHTESRENVVNDLIECMKEWEERV
ncbi:MAG: DUF3791 domain-containing protein [Prevotella sp.]